jgi:hypothetical protein
VITFEQARAIAASSPEVLRWFTPGPAFDVVGLTIVGIVGQRPSGARCEEAIE